jgi:hypothetical protein
VKMWPSNSLQAPTSVVFLGMVAVVLFPRAPRPLPPLPPFSPRPPRPAGAARAIFSDLRGLTDSPEMALVLVALAFLRQAVRAELFVPTKFACSYLAPRALGSDSTPIQRLVEQFHAGLTPCGAIPRAFPMVRPRPGARWLREKCLDGPRWPSLPSLAVLMARLPRQTLSLDFLAPAFPGKLVRVLF